MDLENERSYLIKFHQHIFLILDFNESDKKSNEKVKFENIL